MKKLLVFLITFFCFYAKAQIITTIAGTGNYGYNGDNMSAASAQLGNPSGIVIDTMGNIYVAEQYNNRIRKINTAGIIITIAGNGTAGYSGDGNVATAAKLKIPTGLAFDKSGNLYVADQYNYCVRKINTNGIITTIAGTGIQGYSGDGNLATAAQLNLTAGVSFDNHGNLYINDNGNHVVRMVDSAGIISTIVGTGIIGNNGDGGFAALAECYAPCFALTDTSNKCLFVSDESNNNIRKISSTGTISTISNGSGIYEPEMLAFDKAGNLYIADYGNNRIVMMDALGNFITVVGNDTAGYSGDGGLATAAKLNEPFGITFDVIGNLYITDWNNSVIRKVSNLGQSVSIKQTTEKNIQINLYPIPANTILNISCSLQFAVCSLQLYNVLGNVVKTQTIKNTNEAIDVSLIANGVYFAVVTNGQQVLSTQKIIVQH